MYTAAENPFRVSRIHALPFVFVQDDWDVMLARLRDHDGRGAIVGVHGHGKSTLLRELMTHVQQQGKETESFFLNDEARHLSSSEKERLLAAVESKKTLFVDGAEQLPILQWRWLKRQSKRAGGLIITSHIPGLLPTIHECRTSPELLQALLIKLLPEDAEVLRDIAFHFYEEHLGDLRAVFFALYDHFAERVDTAESSPKNDPSQS